MSQPGNPSDDKKVEDLFESLSGQVGASLTPASQVVEPHPHSQGFLAGSEKKKKFILVKLENQIFGIALSNVREVMGLTQLSYLPNMPPYFAGLINLRGKIISAIDLKQSLKSIGFTSTSSPVKRPCVVITEWSGGLYGAMVDDIVEVLSVTDAEMDRSTETLQGATVFAGIIKVSQRPLAPILNLEKALKLDELLQVTSSPEIESTLKRDAA